MGALLCCCADRCDDVDLLQEGGGEMSKCGLCNKEHPKSTIYFMTNRNGEVALDCLIDLMNKVLPINGSEAAEQPTITIPASMGNEQPPIGIIDYPVTICEQCKHLYKSDRTPPLCMANPKTIRDYIEGTIRYESADCYAKNTDGKCKDYEAKEW